METSKGLKRELAREEDEEKRKEQEEIKKQQEEEEAKKQQGKEKEIPQGYQDDEDDWEDVEYAPDEKLLRRASTDLALEHHLIMGCLRHGKRNTNLEELGVAMRVHE